MGKGKHGKKIIKKITDQFQKRNRETEFLGQDWLEEHTFLKAQRDSSSFTLMWHITDKISFESIFNSRQIYGVDVVCSAHFHFQISGAQRQAERSGVGLLFQWEGNVEEVSGTGSTHQKITPNILFKAYWDTACKHLWELRIYPDTKEGLYLVGFKLPTCSENELYMLKKRIPVNVVQPQLYG